jgi:hypothetical protein
MVLYWGWSCVSDNMVLLSRLPASFETNSSTQRLKSTRSNNVSSGKGRHLLHSPRLQALYISPRMLHFTHFDYHRFRLDIRATQGVSSRTGRDRASAPPNQCGVSLESSSWYAWNIEGCHHLHSLHLERVRHVPQLIHVAAENRFRGSLGSRTPFKATLGHAPGRERLESSILMGSENSIAPVPGLPMLQFIPSVLYLLELNFPVL